ncbi:MAG: tryptophan--tRNA ligase [Planctomycetota bacterium]|jgi:tryptophanyl-tRNA synthetase
MTLSDTTTKKRVLTGDTPTGGLHLGHYVGSIENRLAMQEEHDCFFFIANIHALTTRANDPEGVRHDTINIVKDWLACGIDPDKATLYLQSEVPAVAELTWFFGMLQPFNRLMQNPTVKEEIQVKGLGDEYPFGFLMYPIGQVADILAVRANWVPVGEDQAPHIEMTRLLARRFNQTYCNISGETEDEDHVAEGGVFNIPEAKIGRVARLTGTDGVNKMSKSLNNAIYLTDTPKQAQKKCNKIFTGRGSMDDPPVLENNTVIEYLHAFHPDADRVAELLDAYERSEIGDGNLKKELGQKLGEFLEPIQDKRAGISDDDVIDILKAGTQKANDVAEETLALAKEASGFGFFKRDLGIGS